MDKNFIIERQGKQFVVYAGLLDEAHCHGLSSIETQLLQIPSDDNGNTAICHATVTVAAGTFTGLGDAHPANVNRMIIPHIIRMAETRAKARALRDALNVEATALEEILDDDSAPPENPPSTRSNSRPRDRREPSRATRPTRHAPGSDIEPPTPTQLEAIRAIARRLGEPEPERPSTSAVAAGLITAMNARLRQRPRQSA